MSRPSSSQHRLSIGAGAASPPVRASASRSHSQSISLASVNPSNRINRRKSSTFAPSAAASAAVESAVADGSIPVKRRSSVARSALSTLNDGPSFPATPGSLPYHPSGHEHLASSSAVVDGPSLSTFQGIEKSKAKMRRASDGTHLSKKEKAAAGDLKCEHCGKAYKHGSCLNKHLWEHTPQWQVTSKLLISKHQQVQLLEAASVLVQMNVDGPAATDSDNSSSPAASGSSDRDEYSSAETTPPPALADSSATVGYGDPKRHSGNSSTGAYSRSYQSGISEIPIPHQRQWSSSSTGFSRPATAATSIAESYRDEDPADLAAAVGLLSCSQGTPTFGPTSLQAGDVPPVPPLPAKYAYAFSPPPNPQGQRSMHDVNMHDEYDENEQNMRWNGRRTREEQLSEDEDNNTGRNAFGGNNHHVSSSLPAASSGQFYQHHYPAKNHQYQQNSQQYHAGIADEDEGVFGKMDA